MRDSHINKDYYNFEDFRRGAENNMTHANYTYYISGANDMITFDRNIEYLQNVMLNPRILVDVSKIDTNIEIFGQKVSMPLGISPTAMNKLAHPEGEKNSTRAALKHNIPYNLSTLSTTTIKEVSDATDRKGFNWYQLYVKDKETTTRLVKQIEENNFKAVVITVDAPKLGKRVNDVRNNFSLPTDYKLELFDDSAETHMKSGEGSGLMKLFQAQIDATLNWEGIKWIKNITKLPIVLKGVQGYKDAKIAASLGVHVWVSNHGARQLDTVRSTIEMLPECVQGVREVNNPEIQVFVDGGVRKGTDVVKMLALGANCVFAGRGNIFANASEGQRGIEKYLDMMRQQISQTMKYCGVRTIQEIREKGHLMLIKHTIPKPNL